MSLNSFLNNKYSVSGLKDLIQKYDKNYKIKSSFKKNDLIKIVREKAGLTVKRKDI